jgi:hypothetical protein
MLQADTAKVQWDPGKKKWLVMIQVGAEVIKRPLPKHPDGEEDAALRSIAVQTAQDEGYSLDPARVSIQR